MLCVDPLVGTYCYIKCVNAVYTKATESGSVDLPPPHLPRALTLPPPTYFIIFLSSRASTTSIRFRHHQVVTYFDTSP